MPIPWASLPRLVRQLGPMRTKDLVLTARELTGEQAGDWGLATDVVPADELDAAVDRLAEAVVTHPGSSSSRCWPRSTGWPRPPPRPPTLRPTSNGCSRPARTRGAGQHATPTSPSARPRGRRR